MLGTKLTQTDICCCCCWQGAFLGRFCSKNHMAAVANLASLSIARKRGYIEMAVKTRTLWHKKLQNKNQKCEKVP